MDYIFSNGNAEQKALWREAVSHLLNLPEEDIPLTVTVSFEPPENLIGKGHTDLALTSFTYGSLDATTQVRNDAPGFGGQRASLEALAAGMGLEYSAIKHFHETAIHELGHALFAALPHEVRVAIAQMFGAEGDETSELFPPAKAWQNRIGEAIAETFKEAFLPARYRVFPNRTNIHIPYNKFPEFRAFFRNYETEGGGGEGGSWKGHERKDAARVGYVDEHGGRHRDTLLTGALLGIGVRDPYTYEGGREPGKTGQDPAGWSWSASGIAEWWGALDDLIELRHGFKVPPLSHYTPGLEWAAGFLDEHPNTSGPEWKGLTWWNGGGSGRVTVRDELGKEFVLSFGVKVQTYVEGHFLSEGERLRHWWVAVGRQKLFHSFEEEEEFWGSPVVGIEIPPTNFTARQIFEYVESQGQKPTWGKASHYKIESEVSYGWGIDVAPYPAAPYPPRIPLDLAYTEENFPELFGKPYEFVEGPGEEGVKIAVAVPPGLALPGGTSGAALLHRRPVGGTRA